MNHSFNNWNYKIDDKNIVWLCINKNNSNANVLSADVLQELQAILKEIDNFKPTGLVIYSGKQTGFIMGADINEFIGINDPDKAYEIIRQGQKLMDKLEFEHFEITSADQSLDLRQTEGESQTPEKEAIDFSSSVMVALEAKAKSHNEDNHSKVTTLQLKKV